MLNFSQIPLKPAAYSGASFQFLGMQESSAFSLLMQIILLETGDRAARNNWTAAHITSLLKHASSRSAYWRERLGSTGSADSLDGLPILSRRDLRSQVAGEGALVGQQDRAVVIKRNTSGSTGIPVDFFVAQENGIYNNMRSFAQYLMDGDDLTCHRMKFHFDPLNPGYWLKEADNYAGVAGSIFSTGRNYEIGYFGVDLGLVFEKLKTLGPHFFVCLPQFIEALIHNLGADILEKIKVRRFSTYGNLISPEVRAVAKRFGIAIRSTYSCEECGLIGAECTQHPEHYHIAESNVVVEIGDEKLEYEGVVCGNVLVTHLHSYATPIIRYELGDFASVIDECPCGHKGPTINKLYGRRSTTLKLADGKRIPFHINADFIQQKVAPFEELKVRQTTDRKIKIDVVSKDKSDDTRRRFESYFRSFCGDSFSVDVQFHDKIDWGTARKRLVFLSEV